MKGKQLPVSCLDLGCGTSSVSRTILSYSRVAVRLVLLDFVHEALQYQKQHMNTTAAAASESGYHLVCADVTCLPFGDRSFDLAVDKGTMDALLKDKARMSTTAGDMLSEAERTLTSGGRFVQISDEDPDARLPFLDYLRHACRDVSVSSLQVTSPPACSITSQHTRDSVSTRPTSQHTLDSDSTGPTRRDSPLHQPNCDSVSRFSAWSFKVIPSRWDKEYFIYWQDKL
ncbi:hypothetical protein BsWGS_14533 [Bradybaena similaris]